MIFTLKSLILINFVKKNSSSEGPLPEVTLGGEHASGGPLRGVYGAENVTVNPSELSKNKGFTFVNL